LEGYERIGAITTMDPHIAIVRIMVLPDFQDFQEDMQLILDELKNAVDFLIIEGKNNTLRDLPPC
jgi:hypothetical protein